MTGRQTRRRTHGTWVQPLLAESMTEADLHEVDTYLSHFQNTVARYIETRRIMDLCLVVE